MSDFRRSSILVLFTLLYFTGISVASKFDTDSLSVLKLRLDPQTAVAVNAQALYESVEYIPLQTPNNLKLGMISKMVVAGNRWVVYDIDTKNTLVFNDEGKLLHLLTPKIIAGHAGLSAAVPEGNIYNSFSVVDELGLSYILIVSNKKYLYFNLDGKFIRSDLIYKNFPILIFQDSTRLFKNYTENEIDYSTIAIKNGLGVKKYYPYTLEKFSNDEFYSQGSGFYPSRDKQRLLFVDYYSYKVDEVDFESLRPKYQFVFPSVNSLPDDFIDSDKYRNKKWDYFIENKQVIYGIHNLVEIGEYLYFSLASYSKSASDKKNLVLHLPTQKLFSLQNVIPDISTYYLPTNDAHFGNYFLGKGFYAYDSEHLYTIISPSSMAKFNEENKQRTEPYPEILARNMTLGSKGAPVVVKIKPKTK